MQLAGLKFLQNSWKKRPIADQKPSQLIVVVCCCGGGGGGGVVVSEERAVCQSLGVCRLQELNYLAGGGVRNLCFIY